MPEHIHVDSLSVCKLAILDAHDRPAIVLEAADLGPRVALLDSHGKPRVMLSIVDGLPVISMFDDDADEVSLINLQTTKHKVVGHG